MLSFAETLWKDFRYALRMLLRSPAFTAVAVLSLAFGIGANTALFSVMDALILRMLPVSNAQELVRLRRSLSFHAYQRIRDQSHTLSGVFAYNVRLFSVSMGQEPEQAIGFMVSGNYFSVLGVKAAAGRLISPDDDRVPGTGGAEGPVAVISYHYWERRFSRDPAILGRTATLNGVPVTIVGVTAPNFYGIFQTFAPDITVPIMLQPRIAPSVSTELWTHGDEGSILSYDLTDDYGPDVMARLKPGVSTAQAQAELNVLYQQILTTRAGSHLDESKRKENAQKKIELQTAGNGSANFEPQQRSLLLIITLAVPGLVLLIACANVANLLLARAAARQKEVAVRLAIGAGRSRLIRQFLTESLVLAFTGGVIGLVLAGLGRQMLMAWLTSILDFFSLQAQTDWRVLLFTLAVSVVAALVFGIAPAFRSTSAELAPTLKEGARGTSGGRGWETGKVLVAVQVALSLLLLVTAGLLIRTVQNLHQFDPGFNPENLYAVTTNFLGYKGPQTGALVKQIWDRLGSLPGARAVGLGLEIMPFPHRLPLTVEGYTGESKQEMYVDRMLVGPGFFEAMGIPLLSGRAVTIGDDENAPKVCVVSAAMARKFFGNQNPIGRHFTFQRTGAEYQAEIVGVARDIRKADSKDQIWRAVYCPMLQDLPLGGVIVLVRTAGDAASVITAVRRQFQTIDKNLFLDVRTMYRQLDDSVFFQRFLAMLAGAFSLLALLLACAGLYGVMAYSVSRRSNEIGIRMALGAGRGTVIAMVLTETMRLVGTGMLIGLVAAWAATRLIANALFGLSPMDPMTVVSALLVLAGVALLSAYAPSRRASKVDPVVALRHE
jgi:predicted permease